MHSRDPIQVRVTQLASKNIDSSANSSLLNADSSKADKIEVKSISGSLESFVKDLQSLAQSLQIQAEKELSKKNNQKLSKIRRY